MDLRDANSWPLRSPGILSRRALCRFLPRRRQLLDQPSQPMRNPSHQLNVKKWSKGHARPGDRRPDGLPAQRFRVRSSATHLAKCLGIARENPRAAPPLAFEKMRRVLRIATRAHDVRGSNFSGVAAFEARCTDCKRPLHTPRSTPSSGGCRRFVAAGTRSYDALHHRDEALLLRLAQIRHGLAVGGACRRLHPAQQACAGLGQPAHLRPAIPAVNGALDKFTRLQALKRAGGGGAIEGHVSGQRGGRRFRAGPARTAGYIAAG